MQKLAFVLGSVLLLASATGCNDFFGKKTDLDFLEVPVYDSRTVAYVPIQPVITGFSEPIDIIAGWDELIYVADAGTDSIVSLDQSGNRLASFYVPGLKAIAQDRALDLLALGTKDTTLNGTPYTLAAVYRIDLNKAGVYGLQNAKIKHTIIHPFYFKAGSPGSGDQSVAFTGIGVLGNNQYYVTRTGPAVSQIYGPDDAVLLFDAKDKFISTVAVSTSLGLFNDYFRKPSAICTEIAPPQLPTVSTTNGNFVFASADPGAPLKVQMIQYSESEFGSSYAVKPLVTGDTAAADRFLYENDRFTTPADVCFAGDGSNYVFVVDASRDSLYQFTAKGYEGVNPPPGYSGTKVIRASFGGRGTNLTQFNRPSGVAYMNKIVYVADAGNGRVLRFRLTTDFE